MKLYNYKFNAFDKDMTSVTNLSVLDELAHDARISRLVLADEKEYPHIFECARLKYPDKSLKNIYFITMYLTSAQNKLFAERMPILSKKNFNNIVYHFDDESYEMRY